MTLIQYPPCSTCQKAAAFLDSRGCRYETRHIRLEPPTAAELADWHRKSGLPLKRFFNTSGRLYQSLGLKERLPSMSEEQQYQILATDGMLVRRPLLIDGDRILVGFRETEWEKAVLV